MIQRCTNFFKKVEILLAQHPTKDAAEENISVDQVLLLLAIVVSDFLCYDVVILFAMKYTVFYFDYRRKIYLLKSSPEKMKKK